VSVLDIRLCGVRVACPRVRFFQTHWNNQMWPDARGLRFKLSKSTNLSRRPSPAPRPSPKALPSEPASVRQIRTCGARCPRAPVVSEL
jgi:hypothetical protein